MRRLAVLFFALAIGSSADAVVKVYNATPPGGTPGDEFIFNDALCPPVEATPGNVQGSYRLNDDGAGSVTIVDFRIQRPLRLDIDATALFGPGSFIFADTLAEYTTLSAQTAPGSTAPGWLHRLGRARGMEDHGCGLLHLEPRHHLQQHGPAAAGQDVGGAADQLHRSRMDDHLPRAILFFAEPNAERSELAGGGQVAGDRVGQRVDPIGDIRHRVDRSIEGPCGVFFAGRIVSGRLRARKRSIRLFVPCGAGGGKFS